MTGSTDAQGRPLIIIVGRNYSSSVVSPDRLKMFLATVLDRYARTPYTVVYAHSKFDSAENSPGLFW